MGKHAMNSCESRVIQQMMNSDISVFTIKVAKLFLTFNKDVSPTS